MTILTLYFAVTCVFSATGYMMEDVTGARCGCMYDVLKQAIVDHFRLECDVDDTTHCAVVVRTCKSDNSDISVTLSREQPDIDDVASTQPQQAVITNVVLWVTYTPGYCVVSKSVMYTAFVCCCKQHELHQTHHIKIVMLHRL